MSMFPPSGRAPLAACRCDVGLMTTCGGPDASDWFQSISSFRLRLPGSGFRSPGRALVAVLVMALAVFVPVSPTPVRASEQSE
jgi:hypothetical protein